MISNNVFSDAAQENLDLRRAASTATFTAFCRRLIARMILSVKSDSQEQAVERLVAARGQDRLSDSIEREVLSIYERLPPPSKRSR